MRSSHESGPSAWRGRRAGRRALLALALVAGGAGTIATAQQKPYPVFTIEHFVAAMKTVGQAFTAVNASRAKGDFEDSKAYLAISRDRLATTITFWRDRKKDDAIAMLRDALTKMDELDVALSIDKDKIDPTQLAAKTTQVDAACGACHAVYREQDPNTRAYRLKTGSVP